MADAVRPEMATAGHRIRCRALRHIGRVIQLWAAWASHGWHVVPGSATGDYSRRLREILSHETRSAGNRNDHKSESVGSSHTLGFKHLPCQKFVARK